MNVQTINNQSWPMFAVSWQTASRSASVVPAYVFGMGDVCPMTLNGFADFAGAGITAKKRHAVATHATVTGIQPWRPPVT
jgi:hypothetical protein